MQCRIDSNDVECGHVDEILHNDTLNKTFYLKSVLWERTVTNFYLLYLKIKCSQIIPCTSNNNMISKIL